MQNNNHTIKFVLLSQSYKKVMIYTKYSHILENNTNNNKLYKFQEIKLTTTLSISCTVLQI